MRKRIPLKRDTELGPENQDGRRYFIESVNGEGGSCIVYDGYYINNAGKRSSVKIKECYPYKLHLTRSETGNLEVSDSEREEFERCKAWFRQAFDMANELHETAGLVNTTTNVWDIYEENHTVYIISSYAEGKTLAETEFSSLKDVVSVVLGTAKCIEKIHEKGYLYLDIKPDNVFVYPETCGMVQLFDFDTMIPVATEDMEKDITEYRVSYTAGFSPVEQRVGDLSEIGKCTDIYSLGVLLFCLLFDRFPNGTECETDARYNYTELKWQGHYQKKLYDELTAFFHKTIQTYYKDRYQDMNEVIEHLIRIEKYADIQNVFIHSSQVGGTEHILGREKECKRLQEWYSGEEQVLFVTGMGGIGKSSVVRKFVRDHWETFDHLIYLSFKDSVRETIDDDLQFCINGYEKEPSESLEEYFERKLRIAKELVAGTRTLLIIDNFDGEINEAFCKLLECGWKVIAVTRSDMSTSGYPVEKIEEIQEKNFWYFLFESYMNRKLEEREYSQIDHIVKFVNGHTLLLTLIAKQIARSYLDVAEAETLIKKYGFSQMAPEKVDYMQDGVRHYERITAIIKALYDVSVLSDEKRKCLKFFSWFDAPGIEIREAKAVLKLDSFDAINELRFGGWIEIEDRQVQMHPVIRETIRYVEWTNEYRALALEEINILRKQLKENENVGKTCTGDYKRLSQTLFAAKSVLRCCGEDDKIKEAMDYKQLMQSTIVNLPRDEEEYILQNAEKLFTDPTYNNPYFKIDLYDYVVYLCCQQENMNAAEKYLNAAKKFALTQKNHYVIAKYYDMLGDYYDTVLGGAYAERDKETEAVKCKLLSSVEEALKHMKKSNHKLAKHFTLKYMLNKAAILVRDVPEQKKKIKMLLRSTAKMMEKNEEEDAEIYAIYHLICAWYYTLCEENEKVVLYHLNKTWIANKKRKICDLDLIDYFYIPAANMMVEMRNTKQSRLWLQEACEVCDSHGDAEPYIRKKEDLLEFETEVDEYEDIWNYVESKEKE